MSATRFGMAALLLVGTEALAGVENGTSWRIGNGDVRVSCPLTVGGSFDVTTHAVSGVLTPGPDGEPLAGAIEVDLRTLDSGIALRDEHMRDNYLEVSHPDFDKAVVSEIRLDGVALGTFQGKTTFKGRLKLHGVTRAISGAAHVRREGQRVRIEASFPVVLADYAIAKPQYLGVGVKNEVEVKVSFAAVPDAAAGAR
jgi:hypothetical protein